MRVLLDTTYGRRGPSGTGVYVERLAAALREAGVEVVEAANERRRPPGTGSLKNLAEDVRWTQVELRRRAREANADLIHHPLPSHVMRAGVPQVVTVHDLAFEALPEHFDPRFVAWAKRVHPLAANGADVVIAVSEATARELRERWGIDAVVARHGPGQALPEVERGEPRHFLYVGDAEPRKDLPTLLAGYARYRSQTETPLPLVLAGSAFAVDSGVRVVEGPSTSELAELHAHAAALVHPSRHEGFGLTIAEALAVGTPIVAADTPALRELAGDRAAFFPPGDADALAAMLAQAPPQAGGGATLTTWADAARAHIAAYTLALEQS